jgi:uncharacterized membrane protein YgdD (TMEM256/DUF423 family)
MLVVAALLGFFAVALGAFGAHGLKTVLSPDMMLIYQTAVHYHLTHAIVLVVVSVLALSKPEIPYFKRSGVCLFVGIMIFSGSLYLLTLTGTKWLGAVTPIGGVSLLVGWLMLALGGHQWKKQLKK